MAPAVTFKAIKEAAQDGKILGVACGNGHRFSEPRARCLRCGSTQWKAVELPGRGRVVTFTIQNVASEEFMNETPFAWALIELEDGTRIGGWVPYIATDKDLAIGQAVQHTPAYKPGLMFEKVGK